MAEAIIRPATEADAEAIYELLFAARREIPLTKIETDPRNGWLDFIRDWCAYNRSLVTEVDGEIISVMIVIQQGHSSTGDGDPVPMWELHYGTTREDYRGQGIFKALFFEAIEPFETVYAEVRPDNTSDMKKILLRWGFTKEAWSPNEMVHFKLTREIGRVS